MGDGEKQECPNCQFHVLALTPLQFPEEADLDNSGLS